MMVMNLGGVQFLHLQPSPTIATNNPHQLPNHKAAPNSLTHSLTHSLLLSASHEDDISRTKQLAMDNHRSYFFLAIRCNHTEILHPMLRPNQRALKHY
jgi:hypothetical protein